MKQEIEQLHQQLLDAKTQRRSGSLNGPCGDEDYEDAQSIFRPKIAQNLPNKINPNVFFFCWFFNLQEKRIN